MVAGRVPCSRASAALVLANSSPRATACSSASSRAIALPSASFGLYVRQLLTEGDQQPGSVAWTKRDSLCIIIYFVRENSAE
jgi:hypothetical protein